MCGICGKVTFGVARDVSSSLLKNMCAALVHRGPDEEGLFVGPHVGLAQRRLSVIDLSREATAPLSNESGTIWVTLNGEIYNYRELRADLEARGHIFRTATDTEVVVHLFEEFGDDCVSRLRGMFAFAIWDQNRKRLFAARDRLGKKPFFYRKSGDALVFASEIAALFADSTVSVDPDYAAIDRYLTFQYVPSPTTAFRGITKLPAGHCLTCTADGEIRTTRYWTPPRPGASPHRLTPGELEDEILRRLRECVQVRLVADVPLGAFLSGGIDSSLVVALMAEAGGTQVRTFSIGFEELDFDELPFARVIAARYGTDHHEFVVRPDATEVLPKLVHHYGEPFADSSAVPTYYLSKLTRQHVTVALSGDGGDENFAGYRNYGEVMDWGRRGAPIPPSARRALQWIGAAGLRHLPYHRSSARILRALLMMAGSVPERFALQTAVFKPEEKRALYTAEFHGLIDATVTDAAEPSSAPWDPDGLGWMMWQDLQRYLPDCLMVKVDVASMANSLEVRCPYLDHTFVEFAAGIPNDLKRNGAEGKTILKRAASRVLPDEILSKPKTGFGVPLRRWFNGRLRELLRDTLTDQRAGQRKLFRQDVLRRMLSEHFEGRRDWSQRLWALLCLELWFREFVD